MPSARFLLIDHHSSLFVGVVAHLGGHHPQSGDPGLDPNVAPLTIASLRRVIGEGVLVMHPFGDLVADIAEFLRLDDDEGLPTR